MWYQANTRLVYLTQSSIFGCKTRHLSCPRLASDPSLSGYFITPHRLPRNDTSTFNQKPHYPVQFIRWHYITQQGFNTSGCHGYIGTRHLRAHETHNQRSICQWMMMEIYQLYYTLQVICYLCQTMLYHVEPSNRGSTLLTRYVYDEAHLHTFTNVVWVRDWSQRSRPFLAYTIIVSCEPSCWEIRDVISESWSPTTLKPHTRYTPF
jgi:hypothetical protein